MSFNVANLIATKFGKCKDIQSTVEDTNKKTQSDNEENKNCVHNTHDQILISPVIIGWSKLRIM
jgi:hypothetical protein